MPRGVTLSRPTGEWTASDMTRRRAESEGRSASGPAGALRTERVPGGTEDDEISGERELRRVAQAEHGEAMVAGEETDGEHGAVTPVAARRAGCLRFKYGFSRFQYG